MKIHLKNKRNNKVIDLFHYDIPDLKFHQKKKKKRAYLRLENAAVILVWNAAEYQHINRLLPREWEQMCLHIPFRCLYPVCVFMDMLVTSPYRI